MLQKSFTLPIDELIHSRYILNKKMGMIKRFHILLHLLIPLVIFVVSLGVTLPSYVYICFYLLFAVHHQLSYKRYFRKLIKKQLLKAFGSSEPVTIDLTVTEDGIESTAVGITNKLSWSHMVEIQESARYLTLITQPIVVLTIHKETFQSHEELETWKAFIIKHLPETCEVSNE